MNPFIRKYVPKQEISQEAHELIRNFKIAIDGTQAFAQKSLKHAKFLQKDRYDLRNNLDKAQNFEIGDKVWLYVQAINNNEIKKLRLRWVGVYVIHSKVSENTYMLQLDGKILKSPVHQKVETFFRRGRETIRRNYGGGFFKYADGFNSTK